MGARYHLQQPQKRRLQVELATAAKMLNLIFSPTAHISCSTTSQRQAGKVLKELSLSQKITKNGGIGVKNERRQARAITCQLQLFGIHIPECYRGLGFACMG